MILRSILLLAALSGPAWAERLLVAHPDGFVLGHQGQDAPGTRIVELVPEGETVRAWSQMVTIQVMPWIADIAGYTDEVGTSVGQACPGAETSPVAQGVEGGYPVSVILLSCPASPRDGRPKQVLLKAMAGRESAYVVRWAWSGGVPDARQVEMASRFLAAVAICDGTATDAACRNR
ncbi:MAG: hypothetical protein AAF390_03555 [Pseudomonadota bacterium]